MGSHDWNSCKLVTRVYDRSTDSNLHLCYYEFSLVGGSSYMLVVHGESLTSDKSVDGFGEFNGSSIVFDSVIRNRFISIHPALIDEHKSISGTFQQ